MDCPGKRRFNLAFNLVAIEERYVVCVVFQLAEIMRHDLLHEFLGIGEYLVIVDQYFTDIIAQVIAQGANEQVAFLVYQERSLVFHGCFFDSSPKLQKVIEIPLQLLGFAPDTRCPDDDSYVVGGRNLL